MKNTISAFLIAAIIALAAAAPADMKTDTRLSRSVISSLQQKVRNEGGCNVNVCFAIDGSGSISKKEFDEEISFVLDTLAVIGADRLAGLAATQIGAVSSPISSLTFDVAAFKNALLETRFLGAESSNIRDALSFCVTELLEDTSGPKKIVVLTDGRANVGGDPAQVANSFRAAGGEVCAVGVGLRDEPSLLKLVGGRSERVLAIDDFFNLLSTLEDFIKQICSI